MNHKRTELGDNIGYTSIIDEKFNTCSLYIYMITELKKETVSEYAIGSSILTTANSKLKTLAELNEQLSALYGANLFSYARKRGDLQNLALSASWLHDRFAFDNENISAKMLEIVIDCLFNPLAENGRFDENAFRLSQKDILDNIDSALNDKREYTVDCASRLAYSGEPAENSACGTHELAEAVTAESAYAAYKRLLETAQIEILFVSPEENPDIPELFRSEFGKIGRNSKKHVFMAPSPLKKIPQLVTEELDVRQAKIAINFKSSSDDHEALRLMCMIFGGTPVSKLFMNVREKLSLCYYCACRYNEYKNMLMVDCGVEKANIEKATEEINRQLDNIRNGNISDEEIQSALLALENSCISIGDTPESYVSWYFDRFCHGKYITPREHLDVLFAVTKERITEAAKTVKLDSTYHMLNKEADK